MGLATILMTTTGKPRPIESQWILAAALSANDRLASERWPVVCRILKVEAPAWAAVVANRDHRE